jgi:sigma-E factor negative regulatory protein RseC
MTVSESPNNINHDGIVLSNDGNNVTISISSASACSGCHAEGSCSLSGKEDKIIEVHGRYNVITGEPVTILMKQSMGFKALFLGYIFPGITVIVVLIILNSMNVSELLSGVISISMLLPYFTLLYIFRERINKKFTFTLKV